MITFQIFKTLLTTTFDVAALNQNFEKLKTAHIGLQKSVVLDFPNIAGGSVFEHSVSVAEAAVGNGVLVNSQLQLAGLVFTGRVVTNGTVLIRAQNVTGGALDAPLDTFTITIFK